MGRTVVLPDVAAGGLGREHGGLLPFREAARGSAVSSTSKGGGDDGESERARLGQSGDPASSGLQHYHDLSAPVQQPEAETLQRVVAANAARVLPGATVTLAGGFRR